MQLQELLERLGVLSDLHDELVQQVIGLEVSRNVVFFVCCLRCQGCGFGLSLKFCVFVLGLGLKFCVLVLSLILKYFVLGLGLEIFGYLHHFRKIG